MTDEGEVNKKRGPLWIAVWATASGLLALPCGGLFGAGVGSTWVALANVSSFEGGSGYAVMAVIMAALPCAIIGSLIGGVLESRSSIPEYTMITNATLAIIGIGGIVAGEYL